MNDDLRQMRISYALEVFIEKWFSASAADVINREYVELCEKTNVRTKLS